MPRSIEVKSIEAWTPEIIAAGNPLSDLPDCSDAIVYCRLEIGEPDFTSSEAFFVTVLAGSRRYDDRALNDLKKSRYPRFVKLQEFSAGALEQKLNEIVAECDQGSWYRSLPCLRKHFFWEFEGLKSGGV